MKGVIKLISRIQSVFYYTLKYPFYLMVLKKMGRNTRILKPLRIDGYENIILGNNVVIGKYSWLASVPHNSKSSLLQIGDGARIGNFNHIYAISNITIGKNVLTADKVYISDNQHSFESIIQPILSQPIIQLKEVVIGDGSWLGENVCVIGASIGSNCVIGANSIVNKDIPDHCVAVGSPAKIIKRYCDTKCAWFRTNPDGIFVE